MIILVNLNVLYSYHSPDVHRPQKRGLNSISDLCLLMTDVTKMWTMDSVNIACQHFPLFLASVLFLYCFCSRGTAGSEWTGSLFLWDRSVLHSSLYPHDMCTCPYLPSRFPRAEIVLLICRIPENILEEEFQEITLTLKNTSSRLSWCYRWFLLFCSCTEYWEIIWFVLQQDI